ncbi:uncharacterized protein YndB with AHSA1/START domain [Cryobacterium sp. MP_3.1]|uniref:SRPBCC domain-containing protein n=1 Tax=Cryobacterium sp. MP_3.1 TaxID=3071711 RepID=UPI002E05BAC4|nr:uncharacterized protein YndB with AHSA1/START domain [Cryobacterium sp. MP_3.1]
MPPQPLPGPPDVAHATGRFAHREDGLYLLFDRIFPAAPESVWEAVTKPEGLHGWIGTYTGSPRTGAVRFRMESKNDSQWEYVSILECVEFKKLALDIGEGEDAWRVMAHLTGGSGKTVLTFGLRLHSPAEAATFGPVWDYYLDRLVASRTHHPLPSFSKYYPALQSHYQELLVPKPTPTPASEDRA